jgi:phosphoribosylformylglycinamidine synthase
MKVQVTVVPKSGVLDPQGKAIAGALTRLGFPGVDDVRAGKIFRVEVEAKDVAEAKVLAGQMAEKLLCNPVIEEYEAEVLG